MKSFSEYRELMENRPVKFTPSDVDYKDADSPSRRCERCVHMYQRARDNYGTCEIMRPEEDEPVDPDYVCDFFTVDGEDFPFRKAR